MDEILMTTGSTRLRWSKEKKPKVQETPLSKEMQMLEFAFKLGVKPPGLSARVRVAAAVSVALHNLTFLCWP